MGSNNVKVIVEGNIGAGKSTLLKMIKKNFHDVNIYEEPVKVWQTTGIFDKYYKDPNRWGFTFQVCALATRLIRAADINDEYVYGNKNVVIERSGIADRMVFMNVMGKRNQLQDVEFKVYDLWYQSLLKKYNIYNDAKCIYLKTSPDNCFNRMLKRDRKSEAEGIPMDYLKALHNAHEDNLLPWIKKNKIPLMVLDGNKNYISDNDEKNKVLNQIEEFTEMTINNYQ
jgi:deoxyadenosine/deoxycytidine kinase